MNKFIGTRDFNFSFFRLPTGFSINLNFFPIGIYLERNNDIEDNRLQIGFMIFKFRIGLALEKVN